MDEAVVDLAVTIKAVGHQWYRITSIQTITVPMNSHFDP